MFDLQFNALLTFGVIQDEKMLLVVQKFFLNKFYVKMTISTQFICKYILKLPFVSNFTLQITEQYLCS